MKTPGLPFSEFLLNIMAWKWCRMATSCPTLLLSRFTRRVVHHASYSQVCLRLAADRRASTDDSQKKNECFPLAGPAHVPASVFKILSPPGRQINIWSMVMGGMGLVPGMVEEGGCSRGASSSIGFLASSIYLQVWFYLPLAAA